MNPMISADNLTAGYSSPVIKEICLNVRGGEIMTLIGPNGSGKSTLLKALAGTLVKMGGAVYIEGADADTVSVKERAKKVSALFTERSSPELMTCREVVETGRYPYTGYFGALTKADKRAVDEAMELVGITELAERGFLAVSDGQRQRTMLAGAICRNPRVLLLDEPVSFLDIQHKIAFLEILKNFAKDKGIAVILSMHELEFAMEISDYAICMKDGSVYRSGTRGEIFNADVIKGLFGISEEMYEKYIKII